MARSLSAALRFYRALSAIATPLAPLLLSYRLRRGKEIAERLPERRGRGRVPRPEGPLVWLHGASVGELASVYPLIERICSQQIAVLVTSGTVTSASLAGQRLPRGAFHQFVPLDAPAFVRRFLNHWQPDLALFVESDLWPNMIVETAKRSVPMVLINGRLSDNSYRRWRYLPGTIAALLDRFDLVLARTTDDGRRFSDLGAPRVIVTGNLKLDVPAPAADPDALRILQFSIGKRPVIAAASTHAGEEAAIMETHARLRTDFPGLLTIVAPRHPDRGPGIVEIAAAMRLKTALRSRGDIPTPTTDVYIADTMGELGLVYRIAPVVFMGGSLIRHGGQNPIEPAKLGAAVVHGPHVWNFAELYAALDNADGAIAVEEAGELAEVLSRLLRDDAMRARFAGNGKTTVDALGGALERASQALDPYLMQLRLGAHHGRR
ncbi:MAG: 3-deoxy-D-manno-octulosonic acid transferase [Pseudolabrys sp.]